MNQDDLKFGIDDVISVLARSSYSFNNKFIVENANVENDFCDFVKGKSMKIGEIIDASAVVHRDCIVNPYSDKEKRRVGDVLFNDKGMAHRYAHLILQFLNNKVRFHVYDQSDVVHDLMDNFRIAIAPELETRGEFQSTLIRPCANGILRNIRIHLGAEPPVEVTPVSDGSIFCEHSIYRAYGAIHSWSGFPVSEYIYVGSALNTYDNRESDIQRIIRSIQNSLNRKI